jgi:hypothetical protein
VLDLNDLLDGRTITNLSFSRFGFEGDELVFDATFSDNSRGIFLATASVAAVVPEPGSLVLLVSALAGLLGLQWLRWRIL